MHFAMEPVPQGWLSELLEAWTSPRKVVHTAGETCPRGDMPLSQECGLRESKEEAAWLCWSSIIFPCSRLEYNPLLSELWAVTAGTTG